MHGGLNPSKCLDPSPCKIWMPRHTVKVATLEEGFLNNVHVLCTKIFDSCLRIVTWSIYIHPLICLPTTTQNVDIGLVWGLRLGVTQDHLHLVQRIYFPVQLLIESILYHFRVIATYLSKVADFKLPHPQLVPPLEWPSSNFAEVFDIRKLEYLGFHVVLFPWFYI